MSLLDLTLFDGVEPDAVVELDRMLQPRHFEAGDPMMVEGDVADSFAIVESGDAEVHVGDGDETVELARLGRGDIIGELGLLRGGERTSTVVATSAVDVLAGDLDAFEELLAVPSMRERLQQIVSRRLAQNARPVPIELRDGTVVFVRPLLPSDRERHHEAVWGASAETLRFRFFTSARPTRRILDYLVDIDYVDHFAWICLSDDGVGIGIIRYVRPRDQPREVEVAFGTHDAWQRRGVATTLLGAIGVAAEEAGFDELVGYYVNDNAGSEALFEKVGARFRRSEPGVREARVAVGDAVALLRPSDADTLRLTVADIVTAGGLALTDAGLPPDEPSA